MTSQGLAALAPLPAPLGDHGPDGRRQRRTATLAWWARQWHNHAMAPSTQDVLGTCRRPSLPVCAVALATHALSGCKSDAPDPAPTAEANGREAPESSESSLSQDGAPGAPRTAPTARAPRADPGDQREQSRPSEPTPGLAAGAPSVETPNATGAPPGAATVATTPLADAADGAPTVGPEPTSTTMAPSERLTDSTLPAPAGTNEPTRRIAPDLQDYQRIGDPHQVAELAGALSDVAWHSETDTFYVVVDRLPYIYEYDRDFVELLRTIRLDNGPDDAEGIEYLGDGWIALASEDNQVVVFRVTSAQDAVDLRGETARHFIPSEPPPQTNTGFEGVTFRPTTTGGDFFACQEGAPGSVPIAVWQFPYTIDGPAQASALDGTLDAFQPFEAQQTLGQLDGDLTGMAYEPRDDTLLITSHLASALLKVDPATGNLLQQLPLDGSPQYEGVTLANEDRLVLVSEPYWVEFWQAPSAAP